MCRPEKMSNEFKVSAILCALFLHFSFEHCIVLRLFLFDYYWLQSNLCKWLRTRHSAPNYKKMCVCGFELIKKCCVFFSLLQAHSESDTKRKQENYWFIYTILAEQAVNKIKQIFSDFIVHANKETQRRPYAFQWLNWVCCKSVKWMAGRGFFSLSLSIFVFE